MGLGKILKGIGKGIQVIDGATGRVVDGATVLATNGAIKGAVRGVKGSFKPIEPGKSTTYVQQLFGHKMKVGVGLGVAGVLAASSVFDEGANSLNRSKMGDIEAGELTNMVSFTRSPELDRTVDEIDSNEKASQEFQDKRLNVNTYGAEGDLVFALHNLRNK